MYIANETRYDNMKYNRCGNSGLKLPALSLGLWHNFGSVDTFSNMEDMVMTAFDQGITHFDLANNYGPVPGSAEENFGRLLKTVFAPYRDELVISTKAGFDMWKGPYGDGGSKKYLISSLDQSLRRLGVDYVDIFYHHTPDPHTPIEESMAALHQIVSSGKALYVGISNYHPQDAAMAADVLRSLGTPLLIHQPSYSMFNRWTEEEGLFEVLKEKGAGSIAFCPLDQGLLTNKYLTGVPEDSRASNKNSVFLNSDAITAEKIAKVRALNEIAQARGQSMAQLALAWVLLGGRVTTALIGASRSSQIIENVKTLENLDFSAAELEQIDRILGN